MVGNGCAMLGVCWGGNPIPGRPGVPRRGQSRESAEKQDARNAGGDVRSRFGRDGGEVQMDRQDIAATLAQLAQEDGHAVEQRHEALVFTVPAKDIAHVAALFAKPDVKPRSKRGQRVRRWR